MIYNTTSLYYKQFLKEPPRCIPVHNATNAAENTAILVQPYRFEDKQYRKQVRVDLKRCYHCGIPKLVEDIKFSCCAACKCACYCSESCQRADWKEFGRHKMICKRMINIKDIARQERTILLSLQVAAFRVEFDQYNPTIWCAIKHDGQFMLTTAEASYQSHTRNQNPWLPTEKHIVHVLGGMPDYNADCFLIDDQLYVVRRNREIPSLPPILQQMCIFSWN